MPAAGKKKGSVDTCQPSPRAGRGGRGGLGADAGRPADAAAGWNWTFWEQALRPLVTELASTAVAPALVAADLQRRLNELAREHNSSLFMVAAGQSDVGRALVLSLALYAWASFDTWALFANLDLALSEVGEAARQSVLRVSDVD